MKPKQAKAIKQTKFKRSKFAQEVFNFQYYMDSFYLGMSTQTIVDAMRMLPLVPAQIRAQSRAIHNFERAVIQFGRRMDAASNQIVGTYIRSLPL